MKEVFNLFKDRRYFHIIPLIILVAFTVAYLASSLAIVFTTTMKN
jgi:hypothetical protein